MKGILEICCVSLHDCMQAERNGANRIELCASMAAGGLTPSFGAFQLAKKYCKVPIVVMIRPRGSGFCYDAMDYEVMYEDAKLFLEHGADGIVFGFLDETRHVEQEKTKAFVELAHQYGKEAIFHRAIDQCSNLMEEVRTLYDLGVDRVLTAGGDGNADAFVTVLVQLQVVYGTYLQIQMCGNIREQNIKTLIKQTGIQNVHSACRVFVQDRSVPKANMLTYDNAYDKVCGEQVALLAKQMKQ